MLMAHALPLLCMTSQQHQSPSISMPPSFQATHCLIHECRNVHPTSTLLLAIRPQHCGVKGFLLMSSISTSVLNPDWADKHHSFPAQLAGLPVCACELPGARWLIGDTMGRLYELDSQGWGVRECGGEGLAPASALCCLPLAGELGVRAWWGCPRSWQRDIVLCDGLLPS